MFENKIAVCDFLRGILSAHPLHTVLSDALVGQHWWAVIEEDEDGSRGIYLAKLKDQGVEGWGWETSGEECDLLPHECDCPMHLLELAEQRAITYRYGGDVHTASLQTRDRIRSYHKARNRAWNPGDACLVLGTPCTVVTAVNRDYCNVLQNGNVLRVKRVDMTPVK